MNKNPIVKRHVRWSVGWGAKDKPVSVKEWVGICLKCNVVVPGRNLSSHYFGFKNSRKAAKDSLHRHMKTFH